MGQKLSSHTSYIRSLKSLVHRQGYRVPEAKLQALFKVILKCDPKLLEIEVLNVQQWDQLGQTLKKAQEKGLRVASSVWLTWKVVRTALEAETIQESLSQPASLLDIPPNPSSVYLAPPIPLTTPSAAQPLQTFPHSQPPPPLKPSRSDGNNQATPPLSLPILPPPFEDVGDSSIPEDNPLTDVLEIPPNPSPPPVNSDRTKSYPTQTTTSRPPPPQPPPRTHRIVTVKQAIASAPIEDAVDVLACPVLLRENPDNQDEVLAEHKIFDFKTLKTLRDSVVQNGNTAPFTLALIKNISQQLLTPEDWYTLARSTLNGGDYLNWRLYFQDLSKEQAKANERAGIDISYEQLIGEGEFHTLRMQLAYTEQAYNQISVAAERAWQSLPAKDNAPSSLAEIKQRPTEHFSDFIDRLSTAIKRRVSDPESGEILLKDLAYTNANADAKKAMAPFKSTGTVSDFLRVCQDIGTIEHKNLMAAQMNQIKGPCFACGRSGHLQ
ncbi:endogenous retrovirus group K member 8 Gag polyprotein-like, partial [Gracilinanus agilis]|uniref:endogenous retrovirus group K member 8 Gag polyprotein-like n=1 Tax=Gracilinanus agilis TaxID=191870 RepID=UPI001CFD16EC